MKSGDGLAKIEITSAAALRAWLRKHHGQAESIWLVTYKKHVPSKHVPYDALVDEAICFGWIDSLPRKLDDDRSMRLLSPRKAGSAWSKVNKDRVARMEAAGQMAAPGRAAIERAKRDGSWTFLDDVEALIKPADLGKAFARHPGALENFDAFPRTVQRGILEWIKQARKADTRARRLEQTARDAAANKRTNFQR